MLTYENAIVSARNANAFDRLDANEEVIAYLPMAWVGDHIFSYVQAYAAGYCVSCPETAGHRARRTGARSAPPTPSRRRGSTKIC